MDSDLNRIDDSAEPAAAAEWVTELLRSEWPESPGFEETCYQAVHQVWQLGRLRRQVEMAGEFIPRPVSDYLRSLAAAARVPLDGVIKWAGLPADLRPGDALASGWGRIARALGLGSREALLSYRLLLARAAGLEPPMLLVSGRPDAPGRPASLDDWDRALARSFSACGLDVLDSLRSAEGMIRQAYVDVEHSEEAKP